MLHNEDLTLVKVDAKLIWTAKRVEGRKSRYFMGLEFTRLESQVRERIQSFVNG